MPPSSVPIIGRESISVSLPNNKSYVSLSTSRASLVFTAATAAECAPIQEVLQSNNPIQLSRITLYSVQSIFQRDCCFCCCFTLSKSSLHYLLSKKPSPIELLYTVHCIASLDERVPGRSGPTQSLFRSYVKKERRTECANIHSKASVIASELA